MFAELIGRLESREHRKTNTGNYDIRSEPERRIDQGHAVLDAADHVHHRIEEMADKISRRLTGVSDKNTKSTSHVVPLAFNAFLSFFPFAPLDVYEQLKIGVGARQFGAFI